MAYWLLKTEPGSYSWDNLVRDGQATWDGVSNPTALNNIRKMKRGDLAFVYHTGEERSVIGVAEITSDPFADPKQKDARLAVVKLKPKQKLPRPVTLDEIKRDRNFQGWELVRISRLSVMPVPPTMWKRIEKLAGERAGAKEKP